MSQTSKRFVKTVEIQPENVKNIKRLITKETNIKKIKSSDSSTLAKKRGEKNVIVQLKNGESIKLCSSCADVHSKTVPTKKVTEKKGSEEIKKKDTKKSVAASTKNTAGNNKLNKLQSKSSPVQNSTPKKKVTKKQIKVDDEKVTIRKKIVPESKATNTTSNITTRSRTTKEDSKHKIEDKSEDQPQVLWDSILTCSMPRKATLQRKVYFEESDIEEEEEEDDYVNKKPKTSTKSNKKQDTVLDSVKTKAVSKKRTPKEVKPSNKKAKASSSVLVGNKKVTSAKSKETLTNNSI